MHALLAGFGSRGDVQPMVALALGLAARGHSATVAGPPDFTAWAERQGVTYVPVGDSIAEFLRQAADATGKMSPRRLLPAMKQWFRSHYAPLVSLVEAADVVVAASMTSAPMDLAEMLGKRMYFVGFTPQGIPSVEYPPMHVKNQQLPGWLNRLSFRLAAMGFGVFLRGVVDDERRKLGLGKSINPLSEGFQNVALASEPAISPLPRDVRRDRNVFQTGAFFLDTAEPLEERVTRFLERGAPPVYVGFGSMFDADPNATRRWVSEAARRAGVRVVLLGPEPLEDEVVLTVAGANHQALFPRCGAVVHHGGAGTTASAARAGLPQVVAPHEMDQFYWAERLSRRGVAGPRVDPRKRRVEELAGALDVAMRDEALRERARSLKAEIRGDGVARMVAELERGSAA